MKKKLLSLLLTLAMIVSLAVPALAADKYEGIAAGAWYETAAKAAVDSGAMTGTDKGFEPDGTVSRGQIYQIIYNLEGKPAAEKSALTDTEGQWYAAAADWAVANGLFAGEAFKGADLVTRAEVANVIASYAGMKGMAYDESGMAMKEAPDYAAIPAEYLGGMTFCYYTKVMVGDEGGKLNPAANLTRAQLAQVLLNYSKLTPAYTVETVSIPVAEQDGIPAHEIPAIVTLPVGASKVPGVIMLHGTGSDKNEAGGGYVTASRQMALEGIASIRFDFMGNGASTADYVNYNYTSAKLDAKAAADYLAKVTGVDGTRLAVMGWSQGGTDALLAAAAYPDTFKAVITWAGATKLDGSTLFAEGFDAAYETAKKDGSYTMKFDWRGDLTVGQRWFDEVKSTDVLKETAKITAPVLAINGDKDTTVLPENATAIQKAAKNGTLWIAQGADHTFNVFTGDDAAIRATIAQTAAFINEKLALYTETKITVKNGDRDVVAVVTMPVGEGKFPAVVMNHGHGGNKDENVGFVGVARALALEGIATIRMDFPGCGESKAPFTEENLTNRISDSNACMEYLVKNYPVNADKLGILGYSMGGRTAALIAGAKDQPYQAMVLLAGAVGEGQALAEGISGGAEGYATAYETAKTEGKYTITTQYGQVQDLGQKWFDDMVSSKPLENAKLFTGPVLVMYGDKDTVVPAEVSQLALEAYAKAEEIVVKDADHGYGFYSDQPDVTATVEGGISTFFAKNLK